MVKQKYHYPVEPGQAPALSPVRPEKSATTITSQWQDTSRCKGANCYAIFLCSLDVEIYIDDNLVGRLSRCKGAWSWIGGSIFGCITISVRAKVTNPWIGTPINPPGVSLCLKHITHTERGVLIWLIWFWIYPIITLGWAPAWLEIHIDFEERNYGGLGHKRVATLKKWK